MSERVGGEPTDERRWMVAGEYVRVVPESSLSALQAQVAGLREALEPFVAAAATWEGRVVSWHAYGGRPWYAEIVVSNRDVLRARAVLASSGGGR